MTHRNALKTVALAVAVFAPWSAWADDAGNAAAPDANGAVLPATQGEIGIGVIGVVGKNPDQAGRYTGFTTTGLDAVGEFDIRGRPLWNPDGTWYYAFTGDNLVFQNGTHLGSGAGSGGNYPSLTSNTLANNGSLTLDIGKQGTWESRLSYDAISYTGNVIDSLYTVNGGQASLNNGLVPWGGATAMAGTSLNKTFYTVAQLTSANAMLPVQTGTRRDILGGDFKYIDGAWTFSGAVRHEHKEGSMEESFDGPWGGTAFALPIDYTSSRYDLAATYNTHLNQVSLQYTFLNFRDGNAFVTLPYPYANTAAPFQQSAAYSTPPGNDADYITLIAASNMVPKTRLNLNIRVGLEMQNSAFPPDTADPNPAGIVGLGNLNGMLQGTTRNSPDAIATIYQGNVSADSHPIANADARVYYGFDGRNVSLNQVQVYSSGTGGSSDSGAVTPYYVVPQNWLKQNAGADVGYNIIPQDNTKLTAGYRFDVVDRSNALVGHSTTSTESLGLSSAIGPQINGRLSYIHADRSGVLNYLTPWANLAGTSATSPDYSGAYYQAPMTSDAVKLMADYAPQKNISGSLFLQFKNETYNYPAATPLGTGTPPLTGVGTGIKQDYTLTVGPDINYRPSDSVSLHFFYTYERLFFNNLGNGACATVAEAATAACAGTVGYFQNKYTSSVNTTGARVDWKLTDKLKLGAEYTFSYGSVMFGEFDGVFVGSPTASYQNVTNYPDIDSVMNDVKLTATYQLMPGMDLLLQGTWTSFRENNWNDTASAIQGAGTTAVSILTPGYGSPSYGVLRVMTEMKLRF